MKDDAFFKEEFPKFQWDELDGKKLTIRVAKTEDCEVLVGIDEETGIKYILDFEMFNKDNK